MPDKQPVTPLSKVLSLTDKAGINKTYIDIIIEEDIPIVCINKSTKKRRLMPFKVLYGNTENFWRQSGSWDYFLEEESVEKLREKTKDKPGVWEYERLKAGSEDAEEPGELEEIEEGFGKDYKTFSSMTIVEKVDFLNKNNEKLNDIISQKPKQVAAATEVLVDAAKDAALINQTALEEAMRLGDDEAKKLTQDLVDSTHEIVKSTANLIKEDLFNNDLMNTLVEKSNGTIVQHMTRVYLNGISFLAYYNKLVSRSSAIQKLRISFSAKYRNFYHTLLPHIDIDDIILERVFFGGMRAIQPDLFHKWAVGFLIHDIGKAAAVEYHEGEASYNRNIVIDHVKQGYKSIMAKTNYPVEASLITGYHHEYYGDPDGYGYFRAYLQQYKKQNPDAKQDYVVTFELEPIMDYKALAYFPAKVLEIIDVYDSLTDPHRAYRKPLTPEEALAMMRQEFIEKKLKIDPILFDIFDAYTREKYVKKG